LPFDPYKVDLPIREVIGEVKKILNSNTTLLVNAPPGAGKSTLLPLALLNESWLGDKIILMLEPRRLAAKSIAARMASLLGEELGETVGYKIRFESCQSAQTKLMVLTEGILTRMIQENRGLPNLALVIFDEFHERNIHADVAMALCREAQQQYRPDLKILVMSATLNMPHLKQMLQCEAVVSEGKMYPVEINYTGESDLTLLPELTARVIQQAIKNDEGDILVFLPGQGEIKQCEALLRKSLKGIAIHSLYGMLPYNKQYAAIMPDKNGKRKVVLATSIAETSLTIEGVKVVVDTGYGRTQRFDPTTSLSRLETIIISKDSADQRAGRAGRLSPGVCYRMWSRQKQQELQPYRTPEIVESDLASLVLEMANWGIKNPERLTWLTPPPKAAVAHAFETLELLEAIENGHITETGKQIHGLPCHPRIAHMLLMAEKNDKLPLATDLAALMDERDPLGREAGIDINVRIEALRNYRSDQSKNKKLSIIEKIAKSYRRLFEIEAENSEVDPYDSGVLLAYAFPERIACSRPGNNAQFQLANGTLASFSHKDELAFEQWLTVAQVDARRGSGKIFMAAPLNPKDLAPLVKQKKIITWDTETGDLKASNDLRIGNIVLKSTPLPAPGEEHRVKAISEAIKKEGFELLNFSEEFEQWKNRILSLKKWQPQEGWPDVSIQSLLLINGEWLSPHLSAIETPEDLYEIDLMEVIPTYFLTKEQKNAMEILVPQIWQSGSENKFEIQYSEDGDHPGIVVKISELATLTKQPMVLQETVSIGIQVVDELRKPIYVIHNLNTFWETEFPNLKSEWKINYPEINWL